MKSGASARSVLFCVGRQSATSLSHGTRCALFVGKRRRGCATASANRYGATSFSLDSVEAQRRPTPAHSKNQREHPPPADLVKLR